MTLRRKILLIIGLPFLLLLGLVLFVSTSYLAVEGAPLQGMLGEYREFYFFNLLVVGVFLVFGVLVMVFLDRILLRRLSQLSSSVSGVGVGGDFSQRVAVKGQDELAELAEEINGMLVTLQWSHSELLESEKRFQRITDNMLDMIAQLDGEGVFVYVSPSHQGVLGYENEELVGEQLLRFVHPADKKKVETFLSAAEDAYPAGKLEFRVQNVEGDDAWVESVKSYLRDKHGQVNGVILSSRDITERKLHEEKIKRLNEELEQRVRERTAQLEAANKELESFSYSVSHDLRAPLRSLDGFSTALLEDYGPRLDDTARDYLQRIKSASQRMGHLIDDLLKLSRVTRGEMDRGEVNLSQLAREIWEEMREINPGREVELVIQPEVVVRGDPRLLRIMMENLLGNAWKFTAGKDRASVTFGFTENGEGRPAYYVQDDGAGFDMEYADKLFSPFQRLHSPDDFSGTGIGLATVARIVHRHGGGVWAEGAVDEGATFYFTLQEGERA